MDGRLGEIPGDWKGEGITFIQSALRQRRIASLVRLISGSQAINLGDRDQSLALDLDSLRCPDCDIAKVDRPSTVQWE